MRPVALMARSVLKVDPVPAAFLLPSRNGRSSAIIAAGYGMAEAAKDHEAALSAAGLRPDFIVALVGATDALRDAVNAKAQTIALRMEATAGLRQDAREARRYLRALDAMVRAVIGSEEGLLARWLKVRRVDSVVVSATQPAPVVEGPSDVPVDAPVGGPADAPVVGSVGGQGAAVVGPTQVQAAA